MNEKNPMVTVIIPTFNRANIISTAIESVLNQSVSDWEIIVVDDASVDDTETVIKIFKDKRIKYVRNASNMGGAYARNVGIDLARGRFIAFLDSDDWWYPQKLQLQLDVFASKNFGDTDVVCFTRLEVDDGIIKTLMPARTMRVHERMGDYLFLYDGLIQTSSILLPRELAKATRFRQHLRRHHDWDLCLRLEERGVLFLMREEPLVRWKIDARPDRLTLLKDYHASFAWLQENKRQLSILAQKAFLAKQVAVPLWRSGDKWKAARYIGDAVLCRALTLGQALKLTVKSLLPAAFHDRLRAVYKLLRKGKCVQAGCLAFSRNQD